MDNTTIPHSANKGADMCRNGHDMSERGVYVINGRRRCKACHIESLRMSKARLLALRDHPEDLLDREVHRFLKRVEHIGDCWVWTGAQNGVGYGIFQVACQSRLAHRVSYRHHRGPIPEGTELDHLCRNRACVNPRHLEAVPHSVNLARALPYRKPRVLKPHGTRARYYQGCRCDPCKADNTRGAREYQVRRRANRIVE